MSERDIVERLRDGCPGCNRIECEAANWIENLRAEIARLREERRWVSVGERLPEVDSSVLVAWSNPEDTEQSVSQAWHDQPGLFTNLEDVEFPGVTHWQPLPPGPEAAQ